MCTQRIDYFNRGLTLLKKLPIVIFGVYALEMEGGGVKVDFSIFKITGGTLKLILMKGEYAAMNTPASQAVFQHYNGIGVL